MFSEAFAQDEFGLRDVKARVEGRSGGVLEAMIRPQSLRTVGSFDGFIGLRMGMGGTERDVAGGMPVLGEQGVGEALSKRVDEGNDGVALFYLESTAGAEIVLKVDDEECVSRM